MNLLSITPHEGIGPVKLGMHKDEVLAALQSLRQQLSLPTDRAIQISRNYFKWNGTECLKYASGPLFFMVTYRNDQATEVAINFELREVLPIMLGDCDVFRMTAEDLVNTLQQDDSFLCDFEDELLATNYEFQRSGIRLWREHAFHQKQIDSGELTEEMAKMINQEYDYRYFELLGVNA